MTVRSFKQYVQEEYKPRPGMSKAYKDRTTEDLKGMHDRWSRDHADKKSTPPTSEKLLAVHAELKKRGEKVSLPKHPFLGEETMPYAVTAHGSINISDSAVRDGLNTLIASATSSRFNTPYIAFEKVQKALANFLIFPKAPRFLEGDSGLYTNPIRQFGDKIGQQDNGEFVKDDSETYHLYFEYEQDEEDGLFNIFCEVVTEDELDELLADVEDEMDSEDEDGEEDLDEGAMVDSGFVVKHKNKKTGETKENRVRADDAKAARNRVEGHYSHDSSQWKHVFTKKLDEATEDPYKSWATKMTKSERSAWVKDQIQKAKDEKARLRKSMRAKPVKKVNEGVERVDKEDPRGIWVTPKRTPREYSTPLKVPYGKFNNVSDKPKSTDKPKSDKRSSSSSSSSWERMMNAHMKEEQLDETKTKDPSIDRQVKKEGKTKKYVHVSSYGGTRVGHNTRVRAFSSKEKKADYYDNILKNRKKMNEENLEETSEKTAKKYLKHAGADGRFWSRERNYPGNTPEENATARRKTANRATGVKRAQAVIDRKKMAAEETSSKQMSDKNRVLHGVMGQAEYKRKWGPKKAVVKTDRPIGHRIADIGPGGKEHNVTTKNWPKKTTEETISEVAKRGRGIREIRAEMAKHRADYEARTKALEAEIEATRKRQGRKLKQPSYTADDARHMEPGKHGPYRGPYGGG